MRFVSAVETAAKVTTSTYRILATGVMAFYLFKGVREHERQRKQELKDDGRKIRGDGRRTR